MNHHIHNALTERILSTWGDRPLSSKEAAEVAAQAMIDMAVDARERKDEFDRIFAEDVNPDQLELIPQPGQPTMNLLVSAYP